MFGSKEVQSFIDEMMCRIDCETINNKFHVQPFKMYFPSSLSWHAIEERHFGKKETYFEPDIFLRSVQRALPSGISCEDAMSHMILITPSVEFVRTRYKSFYSEEFATRLISAREDLLLEIVGKASGYDYIDIWSEKISGVKNDDSYELIYYSDFGLKPLATNIQRFTLAKVLLNEMNKTENWKYIICSERRSCHFSAAKDGLNIRINRKPLVNRSPTPKENLSDW